MKWFRHFSDAQDNQKLQLFMAEFPRNPLEAYGFYWMLLEIVAKQMDETDGCGVEYPLSFLARKFDISVRKLVGFLQSLCKIRAISAQIPQDFSQNPARICKIEIPKLLEYRDEHTRKLRSKSGAAPEKVAPEAEAEADTEEERKKKESSVATFKEKDHAGEPDAVRVIQIFDDAIAQVFGEPLRRPWPTGDDRTFAEGFLAVGADCEWLKTVFLHRCAAMQKEGKQPPKGLRYFKDAVPEEMEKLKGISIRKPQKQEIRKSANKPKF